MYADAAKLFITGFLLIALLYSQLIHLETKFIELGNLRLKPGLFWPGFQRQAQENTHNQYLN